MTSSLSCIAASVKVRDFGAIVDDGSDDGPAIRLAIADLKSKGGGNLIFENGRYDIKSTANGAHLYINGLPSIQLQGNGARFVFYVSSETGIYIQGSKATDAVSISDLSLNYSTPVYAYGKIMALGSDYFDFSFERGLKPESSYFLKATQAFAFVANKNNGVAKFVYRTVPLKTNCANWYQKLSTTTYRIFANNACDIQNPTNYVNTLNFTASQFKIGESVAVLARNSNSALYLRENIGKINVTNLNIKASPGLGVLMNSNEGNADFTKLIVQPLSTDTVSTNADALHIVGQRGRVLVQQSTFDGMADDAIALYSKGIELAVNGTYLNTATINAKYVSSNKYAVGDSLVFGNRKTGNIEHRSVIQSMAWDAKTGTYRLYSLPAMSAATISKFNDLTLFNESTAGNGSIVNKNTFGAFRGRAVNTRSQDLNITNNTALQLQVKFVSLETNFQWITGPYPSNILIQGNKVKVVENSVVDQTYPVVSTNVYLFDGQLAQNKSLLNNIRVNSNTVLNPKGVAYDLRNVASGEVKGNTISRESTSLNFFQWQTVIDISKSDASKIVKQGNTLVP
jgi:hypothetical protein